MKPQRPIAADDEHRVIQFRPRNPAQSTAWKASAVLQPGHRDAPSEPLDLSKTLSESLRVVSGRANDKNLDLDADFDGSISVVADRRATKQIVVNLLSNAVKYSPQRSTINLDVRKRKDNNIEFSVKDSGQGIDEKYLARIFERYFRVPGAEADKTGTGLGLAIAKDFIEAQGGTIGVESEVGEGSRFHFNLNINNAL